LSSAVNQLRRCSASAAATAGIRMQWTPFTMPRRWRPAPLVLDRMMIVLSVSEAAMG
jgi:hypothetical protein